MKTLELKHERLIEVLDYDPETGLFRWKTTQNGKAPAGSIAGSCDKDGYIKIIIDRVTFQAHRLAWFYMKKRWPAKCIDHADLNKSNNRWENLREATISQNGSNRYGSNVTGYKGVTKTRNGKFTASITKDGVNHHLGTYETASDASQKYNEAAEFYFGSFARY